MSRSGGRKSGWLSRGFRQVQRAGLYAAVGLLAAAVPAETVRLQLKWRHSFQFAGYYAAVEKGYYSEAGLTVELAEGAPGINFADEVVSGRAQYGVESAGLLLARSRGMPVVVMAAVFQHSPLVLLTGKDSGLESPQDLAGRTVMLTAETDAEILAMFSEEGVALKPEQVLPHTWNLEDLIEGRTDAISAYITSEPHLLEEAGAEFHLINPRTYGVDFYGDCLFTSEQELQKHPARAAAFLKASLRGWEYALKHPEEIIPLIRERYGSPLSVEALRYEAGEMHKLILPEFVTIGHMNPGRWRHVADLYAKLGLMPADFDSTGFLYSPVEQERKLAYDWYRKLAAVLLLIGAVSTVLYLVNRRLSHAVIDQTAELSRANALLLREVAERRRTERAARSDEENLRITLQSIGDAVIATDFAGRVTQMNPVAEALTGWTLSAASGRPVDEVFRILHVKTREVVRNPVEIVLRRGITVGLANHTVLISRNGVEYQIADSAAPIRSAAGEVTGVVLVFRDVTEVYAQEERLRRSEAKYRSFFEHSNDAMLIIEDGEFVDCNDAAVSLLGYQRRTELSHIRPEALSPEFQPDGRRSDEKAAEMIRLAMERGGHRFEWNHLRRDGSVIPIEVSLTASEGERGVLIQTVWRDLTERNRAELALRESEQRMELILTGAELGAWDWNIETGDAVFNERWAQMLGLDAKEIRQHLQTFEERVHPEDLPGFRQTLGEYLSGARSGTFEVEIRMKHRSGDWIWIQDRGRVIERAADGTPLRACGTHLDISERKRTEQTLRVLADAGVVAGGSGFFEAMAAGLARALRADYVLIGEFVPGQVQKIQTVAVWGKGEQRDNFVYDLSGTPCARAFSTGVCEFADGVADAFPDDEMLRKMEVEGYVGVALNGSRGCAIGIMAALFCAPLRETAFAESMLKIFAGRTAAEMERRQTELERNRLIRAIEQAEEIIVVTDAEANIQYVNQAFERITGYTRFEVAGKNPRILKSGRQPPEFYRALWKQLLAGKTWRGRFINRKKDGTEYVEDACISPVLNEEGAIVNYVAAKSDVTSRIALEEQLRQSQKMEAVGQMAGGIAHDFNNLLQVVSGYAELLAMECADDPEKEVSVREIQHAAQRGKATVGQLLAFSRRQVINPATVDMNEVAGNLVGMLRTLIGSHISLTFVPCSEAARVRADRGMVEQVIVNLCVNARDAMPGGGTLRIQISRESVCSLNEMPAEPCIQITVADNGCGMDEETAARIFEPFFTTKEVGKGTGLGLSMAYGIIRQHKGAVSVQTRPGQGTVFTVCLPEAAALPEPQKTTAAEGRSAAGGETILIAEDDESVLRLTAQTLQQAGYEVLTAMDGEEAVRVFEQHQDEIGLVLLDVAMPRVRGPEALDRMLGMKPGLPYLFFSGYTAAAVFNGDSGSREHPLICKPYNKDELLQRIRSLLSAGNGLENSGTS